MKGLRFIILSVLAVAAVLIYQSLPQVQKAAGHGVLDPKSPGSLHGQVDSARSLEPLVVIDPGHGGSQKGAPEDRIKEKDLNLEIALRLRDILKKNSIQVIMTREQDTDVDLLQRARIANEAGASLFLSIHNNWYPDKRVNGTSTLYNPYGKQVPGRNFDSRRFASIMNRALVNGLKTNNLGIDARDDLAVLKYTTMPAVLVEIICLSNKDDRARAQTSEFIETAASSLYTGLVEALGELH